MVGHEQVLVHDWTQIIEAGRQTLRFDSAGGSRRATDVPAVIATDSDDLVPHARQLALAAAILAPRCASSTAATACRCARWFVPALIEACLEVVDRAGAGAPSEVAA